MMIAVACAAMGACDLDPDEIPLNPLLEQDGGLWHGDVTRSAPEELDAGLDGGPARDMAPMTVADPAGPCDPGDACDCPTDGGCAQRPTIDTTPTPAPSPDAGLDAGDGPNTVVPTDPPPATPTPCTGDAGCGCADGGCSVEPPLCEAADDVRCLMAGGIVTAAGVARPGVRAVFTGAAREFEAIASDDGNLALRLPRETLLMGHYQGEGLYDQLAWFQAPSDIFGLEVDVEMWTQEELDTGAAMAGTTQSPELGAVWLVRESPSFTGGQGIALDLPSDPPIVVDADGLLVQSDTILTGGLAEMFFTNVTPGPLHVTPIAHPGYTCWVQPQDGDGFPDGFVHEVRAGTVTLLLLACEPLNAGGE